MKTLYKLAFALLFTALTGQSAQACYATFRHSNAAAGDTVWFYGLDWYAVHVWDFGDNTSGTPNMVYSDTAFHVYAAPGTYYVTHFVNVGFEWDFETQVITVGTDPFAAVFDTRCSGSNYITFSNQSVGSNLSYSWNFGDPLSAPNDTSSAENPMHNFSAAGNYLVTLIATDGSQSDTTYRTISVGTSCMNVSMHYMLNTCLGDTTFYSNNFSGVTSANWNFGDVASGPNNYSTSLTPWHIFSAPGVFTGSVIYSDGIQTDTATVYAYVVDCNNVWPGDVNIDGMVSAEDILPIGLYYGATGAVRPSASSSFTAQPAADWAPTNWINKMYLNDMVDKKNADCNGDGIINAADVQVITQNLGMVHFQRNNLSSMQMVHATHPHLKIDAPVQMTSGSSSSVSLKLGDAIVPAAGIYGYSTTIAYDVNAIAGSSINVDFTNSWLDTIGQPQLLSWFYNDVANGLLTLVSVRKDQNSKSGYGELATISFNVVPGYSGSISFNLSGDSKVMSGTVMNTPGNGHVQNFINVNLDDATVDVILGVNENILPEWITVYPSPATDVIHVAMMRDAKAAVALYDMTGRLISRDIFTQKNNLLDVSSLPSGIYHLNVSSEEKAYNVKVVVE